MGYSITDLAQKVGGTVVGDGKATIEGMASLDRPKAGCIAFISHPRDLKTLEETDIACVLVPKKIATSKKILIQVENPKLAFARLLQLFHPVRTFSGKISDQAIISKTAVIGKNVTIEPFAYIGERTQIGNGTVVRANSFLDDDVVIGENTVIHPNVSVYYGSKIGNRVALHSGVVVGADGFGFVFDGQELVKLPQVGIVIIHDDVEIGSCTTIDRAAIGETVIGQGTKIDNQVQIAHNVQIGAHCAISAQCGISGSTKIGNYVTMGGSVGIADHVEVGDGAMLGANAGIPPGKKIPPKQVWFGQPARPYDEMRKQFGAQLRAHENQEDLRELKKKVAALERELETLKSSSKS
ncbi:MAG: UDP-3-O-(3-hydroxymyristoyl)glucosamine N-acyltransferase [Candidatus Omnitrophica bacterium]|nr:UDP-3-O-(3-hydroxymyristoyl)glucosamine N-acyltransferase [Candidatus Omnitrophota bacterium]